MLSLPFPVRAASLLGIALSIVGLLYVLVVIIIRPLLNLQIEGWASLMLVRLVVSGKQMMMDILGEYLWLNLDETRRRPRFIVAIGHREHTEFDNAGK